MPFDENGKFIRTDNWARDAASNIKIVTSHHDREDDNFADGLSQCVTRCGRGVMQTNFNFNGHRGQNLEDARDSSDAINARQVLEGINFYLDESLEPGKIKIQTKPRVRALVNGMRFTIRINNECQGGTTTLKVNDCMPYEVKNLDGGGLRASSIVASSIREFVFYDDQFRLITDIVQVARYPLPLLSLVFLPRLLEDGEAEEYGLAAPCTWITDEKYAKAMNLIRRVCYGGDTSFERMRNPINGQVRYEYYKTKRSDMRWTSDEALYNYICMNQTGSSVFLLKFEDGRITSARLPIFTGNVICPSSMMGRERSGMGHDCTQWGWTPVRDLYEEVEKDSHDYDSSRPEWRWTKYYGNLVTHPYFVVDNAIRGNVVRDVPYELQRLNDTSDRVKAAIKDASDVAKAEVEAVFASAISAAPHVLGQGGFLCVSRLPEASKAEEGVCYFVLNTDNACFDIMVYDITAIEGPSRCFRRVASIGFGDLKVMASIDQELVYTKREQDERYYTKEEALSLYMPRPKLVETEEVDPSFKIDSALGHLSASTVYRFSKPINSLTIVDYDIDPSETSIYFTVSETFLGRLSLPTRAAMLNDPPSVYGSCKLYAISLKDGVFSFSK